MKLLEAKGKHHFAQQLHDQVGLVRFAPPELVLKPMRPLGPNWSRELAAELKGITGTSWQISLGDEASEPSLLDQEKMAEEQVRAEVLSEPNVRAVMEAFPEATLEIVRTDERNMTMPSLEEIMKMAQDVQAQMEKAQEDLAKIEVEGSSGGGLVTIRATAKGQFLGVTIDESLLQPSEKDHARGSDHGRAQRCQDQGGRRRRAGNREDDQRHPDAPGVQAAVLTHRLGR